MGKGAQHAPSWVRRSQSRRRASSELVVQRWRFAGSVENPKKDASPRRQFAAGDDHPRSQLDCWYSSPEGRTHGCPDTSPWRRYARAHSRRRGGFCARKGLCRDIDRRIDRVRRHHQEAAFSITSATRASWPRRCSSVTSDARTTIRRPVPPCRRIQRRSVARLSRRAKDVSELMSDLPSVHPGCLVASYCYQDRLFERKSASSMQRPCRLAIRFRERLDQSPHATRRVSRLISMSSPTCCPSRRRRLIFVESSQGQEALARQVMLYRDFIRAIFLGT